MTRLLGSTLLIAAAATAQIGRFQSGRDIGEPRRPGAARFDPQTEEYRITGGGANMWGSRDEFYFVSNEMTGDFRLTADVRFPEPGGDPHKKAGWVVRQSFDAESPYIDAVIHGDGLTSLQYRETQGGATKESRAPLTGALTLRLERRGDLFTMWAGRPGEPMQLAAAMPLPMKDPVHAGLAVCSHNPDALETAVFSKVRIEIPPPLKPLAAGWRARSGPASVSFLLDAPAGKSGFIESRGGHLVNGKGERFRIWGVNMTAASTAPSKEDAPAVASMLAERGVNCVRFHFLDLPAPGGILANGEDTRSLDHARMDRLDFFISELKKRGIYTNLNLNVARQYKAGDGVRDHELLGFAKALTYYDERLLELQREYARQLLTHRNPYTGSEYRHEPAVAMVELVNENSIVESWFSGRLRGENTRKHPGTWTDIPAGYERDLTAKYNAWLTRNVPAADVARIREESGAGESAPAPRLLPEQFSSASKLRFQTEALFYMALEDAYFQSMRGYLKDELGVKPLVVATADHNHGRSGYPLLRSASRLDIVDGHTYWQHPSYTHDADGRQTGFEIRNTAMVLDRRNSTVAELSRSAVAGKPYTVSEVNHPFPSEYAAEGIPILAAYGAFQDWDGIFWYTLEHADPASWEPRIKGHFDIRPDPVKMSQLAAGALVFLRGDVHPAKSTVSRSYSLAEVIESLRLPSSERPYFTPGFPPLLPLRHGSRISSFERPAVPGWPADLEGASRSDTGELIWEPHGMVTVNSPRSQALIGFLNANPAATPNLSARIENTFCALTLGALDGEPIPRSARLLLTAASRVANTGMKWNPARTALTDWGTAPVAVEPVAGTVILRGLAAARGVRLAALDGGGRPVSAFSAARRGQDGWELTLGPAAAVSYLVQVDR